MRGEPDDFDRLMQEFGDLAEEVAEQEKDPDNASKVDERVGNEDRRLSDWACDFVRETFMADQKVRRWLKGRARIEQWIGLGVFKVEKEWVMGLVTTDGLFLRGDVPLVPQK